MNEPAIGAYTIDIAKTLSTWTRRLVFESWPQRVTGVVVDLRDDAPSVDAAVVVDVVDAGLEADGDLLSVHSRRTGRERRPTDEDLVVGDAGS